MYMYMYLRCCYWYVVLFCTLQAVKLGTSDPSRYVPGYVWITHGWYKTDWWTAKVAGDDVVTCLDPELETLVRRSIAVLQIPTAENETAATDLPLVSYISQRSLCIVTFPFVACPHFLQTAEMFSDMYEERLKENEDLQNEPAAGLAYDAVWTLALALNR